MVFGAQGCEKRQVGIGATPPGPGSPRERETRDETKCSHHKAHSARRRQPRDPPSRGPGGGAQGRRGRTFSVHLRAGDRGSEQTGTAWIPFSNPLSRRSLWASSCALSFAKPLSFLHVCLALWGATVASTTFWDASELCASPMTGEEGERGKRSQKFLKRKKRGKRTTNRDEGKCSRNSSPNSNSTWLPLR